MIGESFQYPVLVKIMRYISTRGGMPPKKFSMILLGGLASDGGLVMPETYPKFDAAELERLRALNYRELAFEILSRFADDIPGADLRGIITRTYTAEAFQTEEITPLATLEPELHILRLSNGPTLAFKIFHALRETCSRLSGEKRKCVNILGATSAILVKRVCNARQAQHSRVHALPAGEDEPVPDRANVFAARSEHF